MSVIDDIVRNYRAPRVVFRKRLNMGQREDRALAILMGGCLLVFAAQLPRLARLSHESGQDLTMLMGATMLAWVFIMPLVFYAVGTLSHVIWRVFAGQGNGYSARLALFWALLCASPLWLLWGLVAGFIGPSPQLSITGAVVLMTFLLFWSINLREAHRSVDEEPREVQPLTSPNSETKG